MKLSHRCFPGNSFRPSPAVNQSQHHISVMTPWNTDIKTAQTIIQLFEETYRMLSKDKDPTIPFPQMHSLSTQENHVRTALIQINKNIFSQYNQEKLTLGFEAVFIIRTATEIIFAQVGHPQIYLSRKELPLQPIGSTLTSSTSLSRQSMRLPPLPQTLLGLFSDISIGIYSLKIFPKDQIILISRNFIPSSFFTENNKTLAGLSHILAQDNESEPFWIGIIEL